MPQQKRTTSRNTEPTDRDPEQERIDRLRAEYLEAKRVRVAERQVQLDEATKAIDEPQAAFAAAAEVRNTLDAKVKRDHPDYVKARVACERAQSPYTSALERRDAAAKALEAVVVEPEPDFASK
jgi:hypothetical protein